MASDPKPPIIYYKVENSVWQRVPIILSSHLNPYPAAEYFMGCMCSWRVDHVHSFSDGNYVKFDTELTGSQCANQFAFYLQRRLGIAGERRKYYNMPVTINIPLEQFKQYTKTILGAITFTNRFCLKSKYRKYALTKMDDEKLHDIYESYNGSKEEAPTEEKIEHILTHGKFIETSLPTNDCAVEGSSQPFNQLIDILGKLEIEHVRMHIKSINSSHGDNWCISGDSDIMMYNEKTVKVKDVKSGDRIYFPGEKEGVVVLATIKNYIGKYIDMVVLNCGNSSLLITPDHPIYVNGRWVLPSDIGKTIYIFIDFVHNFVLEKGHKVLVNGFECITLGHGFKGSVYHPFWGTQLCLDDLKGRSDYPDVSMY
eukprot:TRINITY_DN2486_c0_g1_i1.p1 TRINITY_DN2486_c0_g1~~TRINITY_DN2486_c0_g1_i1.p1  ORF type:complete len:369 (-),score=68.12 TRINITY_DN2486_c0_g1_i1:62-1168(-)